MANVHEMDERVAAPPRVARRQGTASEPAPAARARTAPAPPGPAGNGAEIILGGRRYRLVPVDGAPPAPEARAPVASAVDHLTARELQIAGLVAEGLVNKQVASALQISEWTVSTHLRRIFAKLGVDTRAAMVCRCAAVIAQRNR
jgi:DNA-binding CsgD family transcriptional regulator